jgi:hypothetical protein
MRKAIVICVALVFIATAGSAGSNPLNKMAIHVKSHPTSCTEGYPSFGDCSSIQSTYAGCGDIDVIPVLFDLMEFTSVEFGLSWWHDPSLTMQWTRCEGDGAIGTITNSGDGTVVTWMTCQTAYSVAPGYGWLAVSGPAYVHPIPNPSTHACGVIDCSPPPGPYYDYPISVYGAGVCGMIGDDPCAPDASKPSTWGAIKALMR